MKKSDIVYTEEVVEFLTEGWVIVPDLNLCGTNITILKLERADERVVIRRGSQGYTVVYSDDQTQDRTVKFEEEN